MQKTDSDVRIIFRSHFTSVSLLFTACMCAHICTVTEPHLANAKIYTSLLLPCPYGVAFAHMMLKKPVYAVTVRPNSYRLMNRPRTASGIAADFEKQIVFRASRVIRVRNVRCFRSIRCVSRFVTVCLSDAIFFSSAEALDFQAVYASGVFDDQVDLAVAGREFGVRYNRFPPSSSWAACRVHEMACNLF